MSLVSLASATYADESSLSTDVVGAVREPPLRLHITPIFIAMTDYTPIYMA